MELEFKVIKNVSAEYHNTSCFFIPYHVMEISIDSKEFLLEYKESGMNVVKIDRAVAPHNWKHNIYKPGTRCKPLKDVCRVYFGDQKDQALKIIETAYKILRAEALGKLIEKYQFSETELIEASQIVNTKKTIEG